MQGVSCYLAALPRDPDQLRTAGEEFRRAALVVMDVRFLVAEHGLERFRQRRDGKRVGGGSGRDEEGFGPRLEDLAEHCTRPGSVVVGAVGRRVDPRGGRDRFENFRRGPCAIVARKIHPRLFRSGRSSKNCASPRRSCPKLRRLGNCYGAGEIKNCLLSLVSRLHFWHGFKIGQFC